MRWDWRKTIGGIFRIGVVLLVFSFVVQNLTLLNNSYLIPLPIGSLLLLVLAAAILYNIYCTVEWYFTWLKSRKRFGSIINVLIHFCLYSMVFYVTLSVPVPALLPLDQPAVPQPAIIEGITPTAQDDMKAMPDNDTQGHFGETAQNVHASGEADRAHTVTTQDSSSGYESYYMTSPKTVNYKYVLRGNCSQIPYTVYGGLNDYLRNQPRYIRYSTNQPLPTDIDFITRDLNNNEQKFLMDPLVKEIQDTTPNKDDQARIAISLVQNINYDSEGLRTGTIKGKYPYEVLYTDCGVCSEKSELLAYILRELGYGVAILRFETEKHDAVGIKCPQQYSYRDTGYCFVESTSPSIVTDSSGNYIVAENSTSKLTTMPEVLEICDGTSFRSVSEEYNDAVIWNNIGNDGVLDEDTYNIWLSLVNKYGIKTTKNI